MPNTINRVWRIARPIDGLPCPDDFTLTHEPLPEPGEGQVLMRTLYIGIAPGVRPLMPYAGAAPDVAQRGKPDQPNDQQPDPSRIRVGERMRSGIVPSSSPFAGGTVGQVIRSHHPNYREGDYIFGGRYWQDYEVVDGDASLRINPADLPIEADLSLIGRSSFTAWVGWKHYCNARAGETIVVSAAAGNIGMLVCQLARDAGLRVIGIASGAEKCAFVMQELGADACIDRSRDDVGEALDRLTPDGVDIYFDNVGGNVRNAIYTRLRMHGRLIVCGMAAEYNGAEQGTLPTGAILARRLRIEGFVVLDHDADYTAFREDIASMWHAGRLRWRQHIFEGLEQAPVALAACLSGRSSGGKILVRVAEDTGKDQSPAR
ncbi:putative oxidoreductase [Caenibius tardaugens NBRC 16725]|uniref:Putative oxidoreductase n=1 Tax=Caenibius tardaugens NBRC 16725 TaxID=1219035 RepID=U2YJT7_9SPHN|nr:NADP-dependent oxidoreductase [Caenibius tardaugens]AZI34938.1 NADP-dependent oxidoreductase [Caenibius tardaugens NBRC 16725]GAD48482.1 putative oxidoreductase [Caenibius tardaugens NBRC 16725]